MSRTTVFQWWKASLVALALLAFTIAVVTHPPARSWTAAGFALLVLVAVILRIDGGEGAIGFEAPVVFGVLVVSHHPAVAAAAVFAGAGAGALWQMRRDHSWSALRLYGAGQLTLSYTIVGVLYTQAVAADARPAAKMAGYTLLLVGYAAVQLLFASMRRYFDGEGAAFDARRMLQVMGKTLLLATPIVAIEVLLYPQWKLAGFAIAFLPVLLIAYSMRNEWKVGQQNVELLRRNRELAILTESSTQILSAESNHEALRRLMAVISKLAPMRACAAVTWEPNPDVPQTVYRFGECMPTDQDILRWVDGAGFAQSAPSRAFIFHSDMRKFPLSGGEATQVLIGIQTPEVIYGILIFETPDLSIIRTGSLNLLTLLVNQTALSIQDQLLRREMREKTIQLEENAATMLTILEVSNSLIGQFDLDAALARIAASIRRALGFGQVVFALRNPPGTAYVRRAQAGLDDVWEELRKKLVPREEIEAFFNPELRVSNSYFVSHTALRRSEHAFFVHPEDAGDGFLKPEEWHENDLLVVPLMSGEQTIGYLSVREPSDHKVPGIEKVQTLEVFATQAVTALQSASQYEEIRRLTFIDALTPAFNHRYFQEALAKEINRHTRNGQQLALAMLDIDYFKKINDTFGHPVGDEILKGLVAELMANARDTDVVSRYGGEEFAIIFPETGAESARDAAKRIRALVEARAFPLPGLGHSLRITISAGVAVFPSDGATPADLVARADAALYLAKKQGRNRVVMAQDIEESEAM